MSKLADLATAGMSVPQIITLVIVLVSGAYAVNRASIALIEQIGHLSEAITGLQGATTANTAALVQLRTDVAAIRTQTEVHSRQIVRLETLIETAAIPAAVSPLAPASATR